MPSSPLKKIDMKQPRRNRKSVLVRGYNPLADVEPQTDEGYIGGMDDPNRLDGVE